MSSHNQEPGVHETIYKQPAGKVTTDATQATLVQTESVEGETVLLEHSSAENIQAERLSLTTSKASSIQASSVQMDKSAANRIESERVVLQDSAAAQLSADSVRMVKSRAVLVNSNETTMEEGSKALLVITGGLTGDARALVTVPAAAVLGAMLAVVGTILFALVRGSKE